MVSEDLTKISHFTGEYKFLSNFYPCIIAATAPDGRRFVLPSVEHAYQASKAVRVEDFLKFVDIELTAGQSKRIGRNIEIRSDWNKIRVSVMRDFVYQKFSKQLHPELVQLLLDTGDRELIEGNWWGDDFWGVYTENGKNYLGKILMMRRKQLQFERDFMQ